MDANGIKEARIRVTVTRGVDAAPTTPPNVTVAVTAAPVWPTSESVLSSPWTRNETGALTGIKSTSYGENVLALQHARSAGAGEALLCNTSGFLCEGTASNIFLVSDGRLLTPGLASGCLPGITRALVLDLCRQHGITVLEEDIPPAALARASEAFLTSSTREVHPISRADAREYTPVPGPLTRKLAGLFRELTASNTDP